MTREFPFTPIQAKGSGVMGLQNESADFSPDEWGAIEAEYGFSLPADVRDAINRALWWCWTAKREAEGSARDAAVQKRFRTFERAAQKCLDAFDYAEAYAGGRFPTANELIDHPPSQAPDMLSANGEGANAWNTLRIATKTEGNDYSPLSVRKAVPDPDAVLFGLWALAHTARAARETWPKDKGGRRASGDAAFVREMRRVLEAHGLPAGFSVDFTADPQEEMPISGPLWRLVHIIWVRRQAYFVTDKSTLAGHVQKSANLSNETPDETVGLRS